MPREKLVERGHARRQRATFDRDQIDRRIYARSDSTKIWRAVAGESMVLMRLLWASIRTLQDDAVLLSLSWR